MGSATCAGAAEWRQQRDIEPARASAVHPTGEGVIFGNSMLLRSSGGAVVVFESAAEALAALHRARRELKDRRLTRVRALGFGQRFPRD